ncbi:hypothetical protein BU17DRAFT_62639 [Hysterangium stoloniferum]|nr:hypothetical protein BU17DRAFT_62639 [Hysterangium stoloniferum]
MDCLPHLYSLTFCPPPLKSRRNAAAAISAARLAAVGPSAAEPPSAAFAHTFAESSRFVETLPVQEQGVFVDAIDRGGKRNDNGGMELHMELHSTADLSWRERLGASSHQPKYALGSWDPGRWSTLGLACAWASCELSKATPPTIIHNATICTGNHGGHEILKDDVLVNKGRRFFPELDGATDLNSVNGISLTVLGGVTSVNVLPGSANAIRKYQVFPDCAAKLILVRTTTEGSPSSKLIEQPGSYFHWLKTDEHSPHSCQENFCANVKKGRWAGIGGQDFPEDLEWRALAGVIRGSTEFDRNFREGKRSQNAYDVTYQSLLNQRGHPSPIPPNNASKPTTMTSTSLHNDQYNMQKQLDTIIYSGESDDDVVPFPNIHVSPFRRSEQVESSVSLSLSQRAAGCRASTSPAPIALAQIQNFQGPVKSTNSKIGAVVPTPSEPSPQLPLKS